MLTSVISFGIILVIFAMISTPFLPCCTFNDHLFSSPTTVGNQNLCVFNNHTTVDWKRKNYNSDVVEWQADSGLCRPFIMSNLFAVISTVYTVHLKLVAEKVTVI